MKTFFLMGTGADISVRLGFCPVRVKILGGSVEDTMDWFLPMINDNYSVKQANATGARTYSTGGVKLVKFSDPPDGLPGSEGAPEELEQGEWFMANGIKLDGANIPALADGNEAILVAEPMDVTMVKAVHDGGASGVFFQDSSLDFRDAGVEGGQAWILINETNDDYAYVKSVEKPAGQRKYCRLNLAENAAGDATSAAAIADADVAILIPKQYAQYPLTGIGAMT